MVSCFDSFVEAQYSAKKEAEKMEALTEIWKTVEQTPGVTHIEKMGKRAIVFLFEGVRHSVYTECRLK